MSVRHVSSRLATVALLGLVVLDVALVATALKSTRMSGIEASPVSPATSSLDATSPTVAPGSSSPPTTAPVVAVNAPLRTLLVALDNQIAWRVGAGSCSDGGATLATTGDGGKTWVKRNANLRQIARVRPADNQAAFIIGADASCAPVLKSTTDGGGSWALGGSTGAWFRDSKDPAVVRAPGPVTSQPCGKGGVLDLAVLTAGSARVLCADGNVRSTTNNGSIWTDLGTVDGAVTLAVPAATPLETYVARVGAPDCAGVQILRVGQQAGTSCIRTAIPKVPGQIAISLIKGGGWLAVGNITMRSTDDLVTWKAS